MGYIQKEYKRVFKSVFGRKKQYFGVKTFTYYLPAPPHRKSGYQEKEFDQLTDYITGLGFDILDIKVESHSSPDKSGLWLVCLLGSPTKEVHNLTIETDSILGVENLAQSIPLSPDIIHD